MENWFLIIIMVVVAVLTVGVSLHLLVLYQHPDDHNQAWFPKIVVCTGICVSIWTILLFPLDVANSQSCHLDLPLTDCSVLLPMKQLWYATYFTTAILAFVVTPFALFYYEADSEWSVGRRIGSGVLWALGAFFFFSVGIGVAYATIGYAIYPVHAAWSGLLPVSFLNTTTLAACVPPLSSVDQTDLTAPPTLNATLLADGSASSCDARLFGTAEKWKLRVTFPVYLMAVLSTLGWGLFVICGGVGLISLPLDALRDFAGRPRKVISRIAYHERARALGAAAKALAEDAKALRDAERTGAKRWGWRKKVAALGGRMAALEDAERALERDYPQGEDRELAWMATVFAAWLKLVFGIFALGMSISWFLQIILFMLISPPVTPFLNVAFVRANDVFPLFGTLLFSLWAFYLQLAVTAGTFKFGLNLIVFRIHPVRRRGTPVSSLLFNVSLLLLSATASVQFCSAAFAAYADGAQIRAILGNEITSLVAIRWVYIKNGFLYALLAVSLITLIILAARGKRAWRRPQGLSELYAGG